MVQLQVNKNTSPFSVLCFRQKTIPTHEEQALHWLASFPSEHLLSTDQNCSYISVQINQLQWSLWTGRRCLPSKSSSPWLHTSYLLLLDAIFTKSFIWFPSYSLISSMDPFWFLHHKWTHSHECFQLIDVNGVFISHSQGPYDTWCCWRPLSGTLPPWPLGFKHNKPVDAFSLLCSALFHLSSCAYNAPLWFPACFVLPTQLCTLASSLVFTSTLLLFGTKPKQLCVWAKRVTEWNSKWIVLRDMETKILKQQCRKVIKNTFSGLVRWPSG